MSFTMSWNLTMLSTYRKHIALGVIVVLACHLGGGTGLFCARKFSHPSRPSGNDRPGVPVTAVGHDNVSVTGWNATEKRSGSSGCTCKKRKCPTIPRSAILSKPVHRFTSFYCQPKQVGMESPLPHQSPCHFGRGGGRSLERWGPLVHLPFSRPLAYTCVLLI